jgi:hypothetical protein
MIADELLERGLGAIGDSYDVPPRAIDDLLDQLRPASATGPDGDPADDGAGAGRRRWPPTRRTWVLSAAASLVLLVVVAFVVGGSGGGPGRTAIRTNSAGVGGETADGGRVVEQKSIDSRAAPPATSGGPASIAGSGGATGSAALPLASTTATAPQGAPVPAPSGRVAVNASLTKIVKTGELDIQVDKIKVHDAVGNLRTIVHGLGGIVADSQMTDGGGSPSASVTLRVPEGAFESLVNRASGLGKVLSEDIKSADVTAQYVDLQARLHALGLTKNTYLRILTQASTIGEILSVQQQVNDIQTQIEQLQGQLKVLTDQSTYATLTVSIDQKAKIAPAAVVHHQSGMSRAVHRSVSRFVHGIEGIVGVIGPIVLVLLLIGLGWLVARIGYRIVRRQLV